MRRRTSWPGLSPPLRRTPIVKGFAVGRTIFSQAAQGWLAGRDDGRGGDSRHGGALRKPGRHLERSARASRAWIIRRRTGPAFAGVTGNCERSAEHVETQDPPREDNGRIVHVTPESAGWTYVGFDLWKLKPGEAADGGETAREVCLVFIGGKGRVSAGAQDFGVLGERNSPFEGKPWSVYVPAGETWRVVAETDVTLAVCTAPGEGGKLPARVIGPDALHQETRGKGTNTRHVTNIIPEWEPAEGLARGRGDHARAAARRPTRRTSMTRTIFRTSRCWRKPTTTASTRRRASPSSASTPTTARSTRRWRWRTAT